MSPAPLLSVVLPNYNEGVRLRETVENLLEVTHAPLEIVVVDNGSTDGSADFLQDRTYGERVSLVKTEQRLGVVGARHAGFPLARGDVIVFSDAHMIFPEAWDRPLLDALGLPGVGLVGPKVCDVGNLDGPYACGSVLVNPALDVRHMQPKAQEGSYEAPTACGGCQVIRRELFAQQTYDPGMVDWGMEDHEICVRLWLLGHSVRVVPSVLVQHYFRDFVPYARWENVTYNKLRMVFTHLNETRVAQCIEAISVEPGFAEAFARLEASDVFDRRLALDDAKVHDDDWYFAKFQIDF